MLHVTFIWTGPAQGADRPIQELESEAGIFIYFAVINTVVKVHGITGVGEYSIITSDKCLHSLKGTPLPLTEENITVTD